MDFREIGWDGMDWIDLAEDRDQLRDLVNMVMNLRIPLNVENFMSSCTTGGFSKRAQLREGRESYYLAFQKNTFHTSKE
jgi:hypothetical protein